MMDITHYQTSPIATNFHQSQTKKDKSQKKETIQSSPNWSNNWTTTTTTTPHTDTQPDSDESFRTLLDSSEILVDPLSDIDLQEEDSEFQVFNQEPEIQLLRKDYTPSFFAPLLKEDERERLLGLNRILATLKRDIQDNGSLLEVHLQDLVLLQAHCPFQGVRERLSMFLDRYRKYIVEKGLQVPVVKSVSSFFAEKSLVPVKAKEELRKVLLNQIFIRTGRVSNLDRLLLFHPSYCEKLIYCYDFFMRDKGPLLDPCIRNYIAILSVSRYKCKYLLDQQEKEFLMNGGDPSWIKYGVKKIPEKLKSILNVNQILAHQPWRLQPSHIVSLLKGDVESRWTIPELLQAFVIMACFRGLSRVCLSLGINPEFSYAGKDSYGEDLKHQEEFEIEDDVSNVTDILIDKLREGVSDKHKEGEDPKRSAYEASGVCNVNEGKENVSVDCDVFEKYIGDYKMKHVDFDVRSKEYDTLHQEHFSWSRDGYEFVKRYYSEQMSDLLDDTFNHIYNLTYNRFCNTSQIDTGPLRRAVWVYTHRTQGILHDDYNYDTINKVLPRQLKVFVKKVSCEPSKITRTDVTNVGVTLLAEEKFHLTFIISESRKLAEMLYAVVALIKYKKGLE